jgi:hypothetical protein
MAWVNEIRDRAAGAGHPGRTRAAERVGSYSEPMEWRFSGEIWYWKGTAPWYFITVPDDECRELEATSTLVSYGWGMIPVTARIGATGWRTSDQRHRPARRPGERVGGRV